MKKNQGPNFKNKNHLTAFMSLRFKTLVGKVQSTDPVLPVFNWEQNDFFFALIFFQVNQTSTG